MQDNHQQSTEVEREVDFDPSRPFFTQRYMREILGWYKRKIFSRLTSNASPVFTKGGDIISANAHLFGIHEPVITQLIEHFNEHGYHDFLFDIGANIGLSSCQSGDAFTEVHMFEPNPLCQKILEVNTAISLSKARLKIYKYALGSEEKKAQLVVPRHNWGGGGIHQGWIE